LNSAADKQKIHIADLVHIYECVIVNSKQCKVAAEKFFEKQRHVLGPCDFAEMKNIYVPYCYIVKLIYLKL